MESFFARVANKWPANREDYHWHILPPEAPTDLQTTYHGLTHRPGITPVDPEWIHLTLLHSAPVNEVPEGEMSTIIEQVRQRCATVNPFTVEVDRPSVGTVAIECLARPGVRLRQLWQSIATATDEVTSERIPTVPDVYYPHISLAYATGDVDQRPLRAWLSDQPALAPYTFEADRIHLVAQHHDGREITWRPIAKIPLTGTEKT